MFSAGNSQDTVLSPYSSAYAIQLNGNVNVNGSGTSGTVDSTTGLTVSPPSTSGKGVNIKLPAGYSTSSYPFTIATSTGTLLGYFFGDGSIVVPNISATGNGNSMGQTTMQSNLIVNGILQLKNNLTTVGAVTATIPAVLTAVSSKTTAYTLTATDTTIETNSPVTFPAPTAALAGHSWTIINTGGASITNVLTSGSLTQGSLVIAAGHNATFFTDGVSFFETASY